MQFKQESDINKISCCVLSWIIFSNPNAKIRLLTKGKGTFMAVLNSHNWEEAGRSLLFMIHNI